MFAALRGQNIRVAGVGVAPSQVTVIVRFRVAHPTGWFGLNIPFLRAPAACWCARATVEPTLTSQVINPAEPARTCNAATIAARTPPRCQRRNNP
ncbi:hypothetical protein [Amycolatopsis taiwanensis]|uniref:hypothetical protein n=1 Tax=Amycolatopsis taiwanensis TaxID=342230 RepID=UPI002557B22C|nr:hypothetical protein [Amycolatopsis taiwanensis]